jgi:hypothetical protein
MESMTRQLSLRMNRRIPFGPWAALAVFAAAWVAVESLSEYASSRLLTHLQFPEVRARVAVGAAFGVGLMWTMFAICLLVLRWRGQTLSDIGWRRPASIRAWLLTVGLVLLVSAAALLGPIGRSAQLLSDWSFYRISMALALGGTAGICLETIFRGFVMTQARDVGFPVVIQILLSAVLCALVLARLNYSGYPGHPDFWGVIATTTSSVILCAAFAIIYVVGRRSLTPAIAAHAAIDMVVEPGLILLAAIGGAVH